MPTAVIVLAAGQGTRMNSDLPKVLHPLAGAPLIAHALAAARAIEPERVVVVDRRRRRPVAAAARELDADVRVVHQAEQLGTGHAVLQAAPALDGFDGDAIVLYGDTPFVRPETLRGHARRPRGGGGAWWCSASRAPNPAATAGWCWTPAGSRPSSRRATPPTPSARSRSATPA